MLRNCKRLSLVVAVLVLLGGCAGSMRDSMRGMVAESEDLHSYVGKAVPIKARVATSLESVRAICLVEANEPALHVNSSMAGQAFLGLAGDVVDEMVDSSRESKANDLLFSLRNTCSTFDFRQLYRQAVEAVADSAPGLPIVSVEAITDNLSDKEMAELSTENVADAVLVLRGEYFLVPGGKSVAVRTTAKMYRQRKKSSVYVGQYLYLSDPVSGDRVKDAIDLWSQENGQRFLATVREGIARNMEMLAIDLRARKEDAKTAGRHVRIYYDDPDGVFNHFEVAGNVLQQSSARLTVRASDGRLFCVPEGLTIEPAINRDLR